MAGGKFDAEVAEVDAYLADAKTLQGGHPLWTKSSRPDELQAAWGLLDSAGISRGELRFRCPALMRDEPTVCVIYQRRLVWRIDVVAPQVWKPNPLGAARLDLPAIVTGTHAHTWSDNREYVRINGFGLLPYRRQLPVAIRKLDQAVAALTVEINVTLAPDQRGFDVPTRTTLF